MWQKHENLRSWPTILIYLIQLIGSSQEENLVAAATRNTQL
jgi:hypothetical protein